MLSDIKVIAQLCIDTKLMNEDHIRDNWVVNDVPYAQSVRELIAQIFKVQVTDVELRIRGEIIYGPNSVILEIDCRRIDYDDFHNRIVESQILSSIWMGLAGNEEVEPLDIRIDLEYIEHVQSFGLRLDQTGVVSLP